jgi:hypothetical protein
VKKKAIQVHLVFEPKMSDLEEEFFYCIAYTVQQFTCFEDAKTLSTFLDQPDNGFEFIGERTKISLTSTGQPPNPRLQCISR